MLCRAGWRTLNSGLVTNNVVQVASRKYLHQGGKVRGFVYKVLDNPLPLGAGALVVGILQWKRIREREQRKAFVEDHEKNHEGAPEWQVSSYKSLPLRHLSRLWGYINEVHLPLLLRRIVLSSYTKMFDCDLSEAADSNLDNYLCLGEFFRRRLKCGSRPVSEGGLVSPCDGRLLKCGRVMGDRIEQVKGITYSLQAFLGGLGWEGEVKAVSKSSELDTGTSSSLYHCVLYLAPGDYHGFHSPIDWTIHCRRHFPGELMSVSPKLAGLIPDLFSLNERVCYLGTWQHGFFSFTAVGATNVGSVKVEMDPELCTNTRLWEKDTFHQKLWEQGVVVKKGDYFGEFNLGSTIILIFEAPDNLEFNIQNHHNKILVGKLLANTDSLIEEEIKE